MRVKYKGPGGEIFPDLHWLPKPGEVREFDDALFPEDSLIDHPTLEETTEPVTMVTETEIGSNQADDSDETEEKETDEFPKA